MKALGKIEWTGLSDLGVLEKGRGLLHRVEKKGPIEKLSLGRGEAEGYPTHGGGEWPVEGPRLKCACRQGGPGSESKLGDGSRGREWRWITGGLTGLLRDMALTVSETRSLWGVFSRVAWPSITFTEMLWGRHRIGPRGNLTRVGGGVEAMRYSDSGCVWKLEQALCHGGLNDLTLEAECWRTHQHC